MERLLTPGEVGNLLGKSERWVREEACRGGIASVRVGRSPRFTMAAVDAYLVAHAVPAFSAPAANPWGLASLAPRSRKTAA